MAMKYLLITLSLIVSTSIFAQEEKTNDQVVTVPAKKTKYQNFEEELGSFIRFIDYQIPLGISTRVSGPDIHSNVRWFFGKDPKYYYLRVAENEFKNNIAMIEYQDLVEINKAIDKLIRMQLEDSKLMPDYMENKYITIDDFMVGYYIEKKKTTWFVRLKRFGDLLPINEINDLKENFQRGQAKIEELMSEN